MKFALVAREDVKFDHEVVWTLVIAGLVLLGLLLVNLPAKSYPRRPCRFKAITGWPCLSCGATRSFGNISRGDVTEAFSNNPLFATLYIASGMWVLYSAAVVLFRLRRLRVSVTSPGLKLGLRIAAPAAFATNWVYLVVAGV